MSKNTFEQIAAKQLTDPAYDPKTDDKKSLEGVPVTEPNQADISSSGVTVLGSYLNSYTTSGRRQNGTGNEFYPSWEASEAPSINRPVGKKEIQKEGRSFLDQDDAEKIESDAFFDPKDLEKLLSKDGNKESPSGNELLHSVEGSDHPLIRAILDKLEKDNMYTPEEQAQFIKDTGVTNEEQATRGLFTIQRDLGSFVLTGKQGSNDSSGRQVQVSDMSKMALALLAQGVGNKVAASTIMKDGTISFLAGNLGNPLEQLGIVGVSVDRLRLSGLYSSDPDVQRLIDGAKGQNDLIATQNQTNLNNRGISSDGGTTPKLQSSPYNSVSHAQLNSFMAPFGGLVGSAGMLVIATSGILGLLTVSLLLTTLPKGSKKDYVDTKSPWLYAPGSHRQNTSTGVDTILYDLLRITDTDYDFKSCVETGILLLLGFSPDLGTKGLKVALSNPESLGAFAANLALSPSYYANLFRQISRDTNDVVSKFREIGGTYTSGLTSIVAAIEKLVNSKAYQFIMIAAGVGDAALKSIHGPLDVNKKSRGEFRTQTIVPETLDPKSADASLGAWRSKISRWSGGRNPLSLHTFPAAIVRQKETGEKHAIRSYKKPSRDAVKSIESDLDAEYMPFYFHDLRTHEIISLPAFITQFDESFDVTYNSNTGYGRQDPVRIYDNTERTMSFGFKLVAFNKEDFDEMWFMVNKLVAMCYPQYSKGRARSFKENGTEYMFTQPFSQVPAASPMIRLRLGDVLQSNYSIASAKKLFGDLTLDAVAERDEYENAKSQNIEKAKKEFEADKLGTMIKHGKLKDPTKSFPYASPRGLKVATWPDDAVVKFVPASFAGKFDLGSITPGTKDNQRDVIAKSTTGTERYLIKVTAADITFDFAAAEKAAAASSDVQSAKSKLDAKLKQTRSPTNSQLSDFFEPKNNAIIRSFNSTRGKGLAGFITSLSFNYETYPYEIKPGSRAPKMIDVSLGFTPIHDLPLGLDYKGELRAPSHPVGKIAGNFGDVYDFDAKIAKNPNDKSKVT